MWLIIKSTQKIFFSSKKFVRPLPNIIAISGLILFVVFKKTFRKVEMIKFSKKISVDLRIVDISNNATLETQYGQEIPVLFVDGRRIAKYRISEQELQEALSAERP